MKPKKANKIIFSLDEDTWNEFQRQMKQDYRKNRSDYLRYLVWKESNERENKFNKMITDLNDINRTTEEGRLLFAALAKITTESQADKTLDEVFQQLNNIANKIDENT